MIIGTVAKANVLMHLTFDEKEAEHICEDLAYIIEMGYNVMTMFGDITWEE